MRIRRNHAHRPVTEEWAHNNERKQEQRPYHAEAGDNNTHSRDATRRERVQKGMGGREKEGTTYRVALC